MRYSPTLVKALCARIEAGELFYRICREPGMPTPQSVRMWARARPQVREMLRAAREASGRPCGGGVSIYEPAVADEVFERLCDGESLTAIGADPLMPSLSTLFAWRRERASFDEAVRLGQRIFAERLADEGWEMALEADPKTAYLTFVRLAHLRWWAGVLAPRRFAAKAPETETPPEITNVLMRRFEVEIDAETGERKVVAYCPNPLTGQAEREDTPGWSPPHGANNVLIPGGARQALEAARRAAGRGGR
ncbi:MAG: hypothetical protein DI570_20765 [Phenylobacterium zucineum]|nr:MAG: hypothetical protein DI570_20765 [Phenylobacterium zucineum]